jgi:hypothetical protein
MGGTLMSLLHGNLNRLSDESLKHLLNYYATGTLSLKIESLLLKELTEQLDMSQALLSLN